MVVIKVDYRDELGPERLRTLRDVMLGCAHEGGIQKDDVVLILNHQKGDPPVYDTEGFSEHLKGAAERLVKERGTPGRRFSSEVTIFTGQPNGAARDVYAVICQHFILKGAENDARISMEKVTLVV